MRVNALATPRGKRNRGAAEDVGETERGPGRRREGVARCSMRVSRTLAWAALVASAAAGCGTSSDAGEAATADPRAAALSYARDDLACAIDADCCVVFDACRAAGLVVGAADRATVASLVASAANDACVRCVSPAVQVRCVASRCTGVALEQSGTSATYPSEFARDHCGALDVPAGWSEPTTRVQKAIGCGG